MQFLNYYSLSVVEAFSTFINGLALILHITIDILGYFLDLSYCSLAIHHITHDFTHVGCLGA